jgi:hypothetical protein
MFLSNILYGTPAITHGGLLFRTRSAGIVGQSVNISIIVGTALESTITIERIRVGSVAIEVEADTTEAELIAHLNASIPFKYLCTIEQATGDGTAIVAALAEQPFPEATDGLKQFLVARTGILKWEDRDLQASAEPVGLIFTGDIKPTSQRYENNSCDRWSGNILLAIAIQQDTNFEEQQIYIDLFRRALFLAFKRFTHPHLSIKQEVKFSFANETKDEAAGQTFDHARVRVVGEMAIIWIEPSVDTGDIDEFTLLEIRHGLWREPYTDTLGPGGDEELDATITVDENTVAITGLI